MKDSPKIYIVDSYALNSGDLGILFATLDLLRLEFPGVSIALETSHPSFLENFETDLEGVEIFSRIPDVRSLVGGAYEESDPYGIVFGLYDSISFLVWAVFLRFGFDACFILRRKRRKQASLMACSDVVLSSGGGFLSSRYNYLLRIFTHSLFLLLGKKVVLFSQSVGPFDSRISKFFIPFFLRKMSAIFVREPWSSDYLRKYVPREKIHLTNDLAFLLQPSQSRKYPDRRDEARDIFRVAFCVKKNDSDTFLGEIYRILKPGGYAIISTENASSWCNIFASLMRWQIFSLTNFSSKKQGIGNPFALHRDNEAHLESWNHIRIYNIRGLKEYFEAFGFRVESIRGAGYFPFPGSLGNIDKTHCHFMTFKVRK